MLHILTSRVTFVHGYRVITQALHQGTPDVPHPTINYARILGLRIQILDFNPHTFGVPSTFSDEEGDPTYVLMDEPSVIPAEETFAKDIVSALAYRVGFVRSDVVDGTVTSKQGYIWGVMLDEERIILTYRKRGLVGVLDQSQLPAGAVRVFFFFFFFCVCFKRRMEKI